MEVLDIYYYYYKYYYYLYYSIVEIVLNSLFDYCRWFSIVRFYQLYVDICIVYCIHCIQYRYHNGRDTVVNISELEGLVRLRDW